MTPSDHPPSSTTPVPTHCSASWKAHNGSIHVARYDSNGRYLLTAGTDRVIKLWSTTDHTNSAIKSYTSGHNYDILCLDISQDNNRFISGGGDKNVNLWNVSNSIIERRFSSPREGKINDVKFSLPSNQVLLTGGYDGLLRMYDLRDQSNWKPLMETGNNMDSIQVIATIDEKIFTGSRDGIVTCYDVRKGKMIQDTIDNEPIVSLDIQSNNMLLVSTTSSIHRLMDNSDGTLLQEFSGHKNKEYRCHSVLSNKEDQVLAGDEDGLLHMWDVLKGKQIQELIPLAKRNRHEKAILWTECNPKIDGQIVTAGADGVVKIWQ
ncbi:unnamed protein product [Sympodiomycopsis kandeliae]